MTFSFQDAVSTAGNWYCVPPCFLQARLVDWAPPIALTLASGGPLEVKTTSTVRLVEHSLGAVFWTQADFVGQRKVAAGDLLQFSQLPRGKYVVLPVGPVGKDLTTHYMCPCGSFLTSGTQ